LKLNRKTDWIKHRLHQNNFHFWEKSLEMGTSLTGPSQNWTKCILM
jgi:hypothetical protein